ncbi:rifin PIR protein, putative [Plasmodium reichenowi]|uniref:Rifin PIR protein, putative n=1 Tax=Plasmodium reichenowi TaxID=5854 RepID=A0A2P9DSB2_PLARE|nr:rifin PIR protein, putative [Plasmodium reichenowi]
MKLHFCKILLFFLPLNIWEHNKNKLYIIPHHTQINRSLCECDAQSSSYDKDADMKSIMQQFDDRTSQRFEEYKERLKDKRQKGKEERDKNIQKIIEKDKMDKSLAEKIEKGCLRCGCGLGGVAASVGIFGGLGVYGWKSSALAAAAQKGTEAGIAKAITDVISKFGLETISGVPLKTVLNANFFKHPMTLYNLVQGEYNRVCEGDSTNITSVLCSYKSSNSSDIYRRISENVHKVANDAHEAATTVESGEFAKVTTASTELYSAIGYSVLAILIIVLVMVIIYLILRYRRKKKMNKKAH